MSASTSPSDHSPVIVGVGQYLHREGPALEPAALMTEAAQLALADTAVEVPASRIDVIAAVPTLSWRYRDAGRIVAEDLGATDARTWYATMGGNTPQSLVNRLALAISEGEVDLGIVCGAEAVRSRSASRREGERPTWTTQGDEVVPDWQDSGDFFLGHPTEIDVGVVMPTSVYPMFENALWHRSGRTRDEHLRHIGEMWAGFSQVAADNPYAWNRTAYTADELVTPTERNRYIGSPYTKLMVANPNVDMSAAIVICSAATARSLGVPADRWVYLHAGTDGVDRRLSERADFVSSPAIRIAGQRALELADVDVDDVAHLDVYSCFPSAVQIATEELGIDDGRRLTVYGGLPFAGGPWNNPVSHAIASMVSTLRDDPGSYGLVTANGGHIDKHAFGVYSTAPPANGFRYDRPQELIDAVPGREVDAQHTGPARIEAWTVVHDRAGAPERAHAICLTPAGTRVWGVTDDPDLMARMVVEDMGDAAVVISDDHRMTAA